MPMHGSGGRLDFETRLQDIQLQDIQLQDIQLQDIQLQDPQEIPP
jgi:hypothetical protein